MILYALLFSLQVNAVSQWEDVPAPFWGSSEVHGRYQSGCFFGGEDLVPSTALWEFVKIDRNRHYGHPQLRKFLERMGAHAKQQRYGKLILGDTSLPAGGRLAFGHASHQMGIETDIRFDFYNGPGMTMAERNSWAEVPIAEVTDLGRGRWRASVIEIRYRNEYMDMVRAAAMDPEVNRIFISPSLKVRLCDLYARPGNYPEWLLKVRPYSGHTAHFHVRMNCPENSPGCVDQGLPGRDPTDPTLVGCAGNSLHYWMTGEDLSPGPTPAPGPSNPPASPLACRQALARAVVVRLPSQIKCLTNIVGTGSARRTQLRCHDYLRHRNFATESTCTPRAIEQRPQPCVTVPPP